MAKKKQPSTRLPPWGVGVQATLALGAIGACGDYFAFHPLLGFGAGAVGACCSVLRAVGDEQGTNPDRVTIQLGRWAGLGGWLSWVWLESPTWVATDALSLTAMGALAAGSQVGAHLTPRAAKPEKEPSTGLVLRSSARAAQEWQDRITTRVGSQARGTVVSEVTPWPNGAGKDVRVVLPVGGATADNLRMHLAGLANDADLPHGCTIELIEPQGEGQRTISLRVPTVNQLAENIPHPCSTEQRSVMDGVPFGDHPNADTATAPIREESWLVVGQRGSGKTTLLHGMTATVGMCSDAIVWHLDLNGGGMTQPWVDAWLDGRVQRCPVDWAAPTVDEGLLMLQAAVRIAKHRKTAYRRRKKAHNTNLLPVGPDLPEIVIMLDEGAEALEAAGKGKAGKLADLLAEVQRIARNEAVNLVVSALRGTGDLVPAGMTAQTGVGVCMKVKYTKEIASVFESAWELKLKPEHLTSKGAGWLGVDGGHPTRFQAWNILPDDMERVALRIAEVRPDLDAASAEIAGHEYASRYERMRELFAEGAEPAVEEATAPEEPTLEGGATAGWGDPGDIARGQTAVLERPAIAPAEARGRVVPRVLVDALAVFDDAGATNVPRRLLAQRITDGDEDRLRFLLKAEGVSPLSRPFRWDGELVRGYSRSDVEAAMA